VDSQSVRGIGAVSGAGSARKCAAVRLRRRQAQVKTKVAPVYPELAKRMSVSGKVKIEVIITPDGRVKSTRALVGTRFWCSPASMR